MLIALLLNLDPYGLKPNCEGYFDYGEHVKFVRVVLSGKMWISTDLRVNYEVGSLVRKNIFVCGDLDVVAMDMATFHMPRTITFITLPDMCSAVATTQASAPGVCRFDSGGLDSINISMTKTHH